MSSWIGVGVMSGSSLDGLDLCCVEFTGDFHTDTWSYRILRAVTVEYGAEWTTRLREAHRESGEGLARLHADYGHLVGQLIRDFLAEGDQEPKFVACHGHTVFHQPDNSFTFQLGDGETIVAHLTCPLVTNFRNKDLALGGQGAPLVPVGETYLFSQYDMCLNLGGIANISFNDLGFDVVPCNMILNHLATRNDSQLTFDKDGQIARGGDVIPEILDQLDSLPYYTQPPPKSLGKEWFDSNILPLIDNQLHSARDMLRTTVEHITNQVVRTLQDETVDSGGGPKSLLVTGGGALNRFLVERLHAKLQAADLGHITATECDEDTVNFKEALIFAFLGLRCLLGLPNISHTVTGSSTDSVSGSIHLPPVQAPLCHSSTRDYRFHFRASITPGPIPPLKRKGEPSGAPYPLTADQASPTSPRVRAASFGAPFPHQNSF